MILDNGNAWNGCVYRSLSQVAKAMTGTNWTDTAFRAEGGQERRFQQAASKAGSPISSRWPSCCSARRACSGRRSLSEFDRPVIATPSNARGKQSRDPGAAAAARGIPSSLRCSQWHPTLAARRLVVLGAQPPLRPLHPVVRETEFCGQRLAGDFRRRARENGRNSVRRPRFAVTGANFRAALAWGGPDESCEIGDFGAWNGEASAEIVEEGDFELPAGLGEPEHDVAGVAASVAEGPAGDFALGDEDADVVFRGVGVQRNMGMVEDAQEIVLEAKEAPEQAVEGGVACEFRFIPATYSDK